MACFPGSKWIFSHYSPIFLYFYRIHQYFFQGNSKFEAVIECKSSNAESDFGQVRFFPIFFSSWFQPSHIISPLPIFSNCTFFSYASPKSEIFPLKVRRRTVIILPSLPCYLTTELPHLASLRRWGDYATFTGDNGRLGNGFFGPEEDDPTYFSVEYFGLCDGERCQ